MEDTDFSEIWYIVLNPVSGRGMGLRAWEQLQPRLDRAGIRYLFGISEYHRHTIELVGSFYALGCRKFLGIGGDGTLNEIVNGIFRLKTETDSLSTVGLIPIGTGNDWVKNFESPLTVSNVVDRLYIQNIVFQDIGVIEIPGISNHFFANVAGAGLDGQVVQELEASTSGSGKGKLSYVKSLLSALFHFKAFTLKGIFGNGEAICGDTLVFTAAKGQYFGNGMHISPKSKLDNGLLDLTWVKNDSKWRIFPQLPHLFTGKIARISFVQKWQEEKVEVEFSSPVPVQMDGEWLGEAKMVKFSVIPRGLCVLT